MCIGYWVAFLYLPIILLVTFASVKVEVLFIGNIPRMNENGQRKMEKYFLKFRKRELFIRLKVNNISNAILRAINYHLL